MKKPLLFFPDFKKQSLETLTQQYRELSKKHHPDTNTGTEETMTALNKEFDYVSSWHKKRIDQRNKNIEILKKLSNKTLEGMMLIQPKFEPEIKSFLQSKSKAYVNKIVPESYRELAQALLNKVISEADLLEAAKKGLFQFNNHINKLKK